MTEAAAEGAREAARELDAQGSLRIDVRKAEEAQADELREADAYLFCAPENLGSLSGAMKEFFDRNYYSVLDELNGRPYVAMVSAGSDGQGAVRQIERICTGWRLRAVAPALIVNTDAQTPQAILAPKTLDDAGREACRALGGTLAALLLL